MIMAIINTAQVNESNIDLVYCYSIDNTKAIVTHDGEINNSALLEYKQLSDLLLTPDWKQPEDVTQ